MLSDLPENVGLRTPLRTRSQRWRAGKCSARHTAPESAQLEAAKLAAKDVRRDTESASE